MKLKMGSEEIKGLEMRLNIESNSQNKEDSVENTSGTFIEQSVPNGSQLHKMPSVEIRSISKEEEAIRREESVSVVPDSVVESVSNRIFNIEDSNNHRQSVYYSSESSDFETDESSDSDEFFRNLHKNVVLPPAKVPSVMKTKGELLPFDLPPVEDLHITEDVTNLQKIGNILHIVVDPERKEFFVVVESVGNSSPLNEDSVLFLSSGEPLGKIHDVFGNVNKPTYVIRFNKPDDIYDKGVTKGQDLYYSPANVEFTHYVLVDNLKQQKGSDASWKDNNEPPDDQIDYSDDEQEKLAKQKRRAKNRKNDRNWDSEEDDVAPNKMERRQVIYQQEQAFQERPSRNKFRPPISGSSRLSQSCSSPKSFISTPSPPSAVSPDTSGLSRNALSPHSFRPISFLQRSQPSSQSFGPLPQSSVPNPTPFGLFTQNRVPTPQSFGTFPQSSIPTYQSFTAPPNTSGLQSNALSPQPFGPISFLQRSLPSAQSFRPFPQSSVPNPTPFGPFTHSRMLSPQSFGTFSQSNVPPYQSFTAPPNSHLFTAPHLTSSYVTGAPQQNPSSLMPAPQNNVPLQQQFLLQSQQPVTSFLSRPPPNYNTNQNSRTSLHHNQSFTPATFGVLPAAVHTVPNTSNQNYVNQVLGTTNRWFK